MSPLQYHVLWVAVALLAIAVASGFLTRWWRRRELRRRQAEQALDSLARYSEWVAAQRRGFGFLGEPPPSRCGLAALCAQQPRDFPALAPCMVPLLRVHARLLDFLWRQHALRQIDTEAWLDSDHDRRFLALWAEHRAAVHSLAEALRAVAGEGLADPQPEAVFPA
jgi:hypothetical protein